MAVLEDGSGRRASLVADVRRVLVDGAEPRPPVAALAALLSASGTLPQFDREIPWSSPVITRIKELEQGNRGAEAASEAVARTMTAIIVNHVIIAASHPAPGLTLIGTPCAVIQDPARFCGATHWRDPSGFARVAQGGEEAGPVD